MRGVRTVFVVVFVSLAAFAADPPLEPRMSLQERVAQAKLIAVGKLGPPGGQHTTTSVRVERVLFGTLLTNKTLLITYTGTRWLIPEIASRTHVPRRGSRW